MTTSAAGSLTVRTDFLATVTGRLGYAWDRLLLYAKGGGAFAHDEYRLVTTGVQTFVTLPSSTFCEANAGQFLFPGCTLFTGAQNFDFDIKQNRAGWTVGAGLEYAIAPHWTIKAEYNYMDFGNKTVGFGPFNVEVHEHLHAFKVGVNYLFNLFGKGPAPVVARY